MQNCVTPLPTPFTLQILVVLVDDSPLGAHVFLFSILRFLFFSQISLAFLCENSVWLIYDLGRISLCFIILFFLEEQKRTETKEASESQFSQISLSAGALTAREGFHTHDSRGSLLVMQCEVID